jgi:hypothetical protein
MSREVRRLIAHAGSSLACGTNARSGAVRMYNGNFALHLALLSARWEQGVRGARGHVVSARRTLRMRPAFLYGRGPSCNEGPRTGNRVFAALPPANRVQTGEA